MLLNRIILKVVDSLRLQNLKIVTAESCTGGLIAALLTELPGSSAWFERGFVVYSNLAKQEMLGVSSKLIEKHGAVSEEIAIAMATGALARSAAIIAVAVTGIAGPTGGSKNKPVGTVWFAWAKTNMQCRSLHMHFGDKNRRQIRALSCKLALEGLCIFDI